MANPIRTIAVDWRPLSGFPYEVSSDGRVRRTAGGSNNAKPGRILKSYTDTYGYLVVRLSKNGSVYDRKVHRLVCETFHGPSDLPEVRHLDGDPTNNHASNLAWGTSADNAADREKHGRTRRGEASPRAKLTASQVAAIREAYVLAREGRQRVPRGWRAQMANQYGITVNGLSTIISGSTYKAVAP